MGTKSNSWARHSFKLSSNLSSNNTTHVVSVQTDQIKTTRWPNPARNDREFELTCVCVWIVRFKRPHSARESRFYTDRLIANPFSCAGSRVLILFSDSNALLARPTQSNFNPRFRCFLSFSAWLTCCSLQSRLPSRAGSLETAAENFPIKWKANKSIDFRINPSASN